jgi:hypothetical protein
MLKESLTKIQPPPSGRAVDPPVIPRVTFSDVGPQPNIAPVPKQQPAGASGLVFNPRFNSHRPSQSKQIAVQPSADDGLPNPSLDECPTLVPFTVADVCSKDRTRPTADCIAALTPRYQRECVVLATQQRPAMTKPEDCMTKLHNAVSEFCAKNPMPSVYDSDADCTARLLARECKEKSPN